MASGVERSMKGGKKCLEEIVTELDERETNEERHATLVRTQRKEANFTIREHIHIFHR